MHNRYVDFSVIVACSIFPLYSFHLFEYARNISIFGYYGAIAALTAVGNWESLCDEMRQIRKLWSSRK